MPLKAPVLYILGYTIEFLIGLWAGDERLQRRLDNDLNKSKMHQIIIELNSETNGIQI